MDSEPSQDAGARLEAWRAAGADRLDPLRFRFLEAMARRAMLHAGEARALIDRRLAERMATYGEDLERRRCAEEDASPAAVTPSQCSPFAPLLERLAAHTPADTAELKALSRFRPTWSRLRADRRLTQSLARLPGNAGPLNSHHLVLRALKLMREVSPDYLNRFMAHVDVLVAAESLAAPALAKAEAKKGGRRRGG